MTDERGGRYFREARFFLAGDKVAAQSHIGEARVLMGYMRDQLALGGPPIQVQYAALQDGTQIKATMMNGQYQAQIISPYSEVKKRRRLGGIWVRPYASPVGFASAGPYPTDAYDWSVVIDGEVTTSHVGPLLYSNRMWVSAAGEVYCVVGGMDRDKYMGTLGSVISKDGVQVFSTPNLAGVAVFNQQLVVVVRESLPAGVSPARERVQYKILVGGEEKLVTPVLDALADGGYLHAASDYRFSQPIVVFNSDGSEGSCVLGGTKRLVFSLAETQEGVTVTHALESIPSTDETYTEVDGDLTIINNTCTYGGVGGFTHSTQYLYLERHIDRRAYTVAALCDYWTDIDGIDRVRYLLLDYHSGTYEVNTTTSDTSLFVTRFSIEYSPFSGSFSDADDFVTASGCVARFSTGENVYTFGQRNTTTNRVTWDGGTYIFDNRFASGFDARFLSIDIKHMFAYVVDTAGHEMTTAITTTVDDPPTGNTYYTSDTTKLTYASMPSPPSVLDYTAKLIAEGVELRQTVADEHITQTTSSSETNSLRTAYNKCDLPSSNLSSTVDARIHSAPILTRDTVRPLVFSVAEGDITEDYSSSGFVIPRRDGNVALVFLSAVDTAPASYLLTENGVDDVTAAFDPFTPGEPITRHYGVTSESES